jgi:alpha-beta hydrolase superfamily lysophospholipase
MIRDALYFDDGLSSFFGWHHHDDTVPPRDCVAVICGPVGYEYTRAHRTLRHLADRLAGRGIPAIRFDYHGIGDSPGSDLDPARLQTWQANIRTAIHRARELTGRQRVCLIGVRLGATLAALVTNDVHVDLLVLWTPCVQGRPYLRELQAIALTAERTASEIEGALESAGFVMSAETIADLRKVNLLESTIDADRVLVIGRDDVAPDDKLSDKLKSAGVPTDSIRVPGWAGMMAEHQFTVVPDAALEKIVGWVESHVALDAAAVAPGAATAAMDRGPITFPFDASLIEETLCHFGPDDHLFGILSRTALAPDRPAIVMFNAGAVHHVGPNRVYVTLARHLSAAGFPCFRFDLEGIGDSVLRTPGRENHPYPDTALADAGAAFDFLKERFGYTRFIAMGLCSGAHTTFHTGLQLENDSIEELILINPLTFYWKEGMSLETTRNFEDAVAYKRSARDPRRWLKLLRGDVNMKRLAEVVVSQLKTKLHRREDPRLSQDLRKLRDMKRPVTFFIAEGDPGREILMAGAKCTAKKALKSGHMRLETIPGADHTFSQFRPRKDLLDRIGAHLKRHTPPPASPPR